MDHARYYVTLRRGKRVGYLVGPCDTEQEARTYVDGARHAAEEIDPFACFDLFGVTRVEWTGATFPSPLPPGVLNEQVGFTRGTAP